jgi:hypothetical protein
MWKKLIQAAAITSVLYLLVGMSKSPLAQPSQQGQLGIYTRYQPMLDFFQR